MTLPVTDPGRLSATEPKPVVSTFHHRVIYARRQVVACRPACKGGRPKWTWSWYGDSNPEPSEYKTDRLSFDNIPAYMEPNPGYDPRGAPYESASLPISLIRHMWHLLDAYMV